MVNANNATFQNTPKTLNRIRVNTAIDIFALIVLYKQVVVNLIDLLITYPFIRINHCIFNGLDNFRCDMSNRCRFNLASDNLALSFDHSENWRFILYTPALRIFDFFICMTIFVLATDIGFINLNFIIQFTIIFTAETFANTLQHKPRCFLRYINIASELQ